MLTIGGLCSAEDNKALAFQTASYLIKCTKFSNGMDTHIAYTACYMPFH